MRRSSRGNPYHDARGRFCSRPKGIYTNENNDGTVYAQFFNDSECTDEYDSHEFSAEEIRQAGGIDNAMNEYLGVTRSEKSPEEYEKRTEERMKASLPKTDFEMELKERAENNANQFISEWMDAVGVGSFEIRETSYDYKTSTVKLVVSETDPNTDPTPFELQLCQDLNGRTVLYNEDGGYDVIEDAYENGLIDDVDLDWFRNYRI